MGVYIKNFEPQDGLYVIKDGVIRKYKGNGGTVRPYELVEVKEPHGRLIDAAVEAADEWDGGYSRSREEIITLKLRMLPSANKSGHWVMNPSEVAGEGYYICSNCNNDVYDATDFCPNCGADMRGDTGWMI